MSFSIKEFTIFIFIFIFIKRNPLKGADLPKRNYFSFGLFCRVEFTNLFHQLYFNLNSHITTRRTIHLHNKQARIVWIQRYHMQEFQGLFQDYHIRFNQDSFHGIQAHHQMIAWSNINIKQPSVSKCHHTTMYVGVKPSYA